MYIYVERERWCIVELKKPTSARADFKWPRSDCNDSFSECTSLACLRSQSSMYSAQTKTYSGIDKQTMEIVWRCLER